MNQMPEVCLSSSRPDFTPKQGQYLAFIHAYTLVLGRPPAEADMQRHFGVTPPSVHQMVLTLEHAGLIRRQPGVARSIEVLVNPQDLPPLRPRNDQPVISSVPRY
jgi:DNA-binding MarR family transcriptional regulator